MTELSTTLSSSHRFQSAEYRRVGYLTNGWDPVQRWDGRTSTLTAAGILGPSQDADSWVPVPSTAAGSDSTVGIHVFRYRYLDSQTGYVSNPSEEREVTIASGALALTFTVENASSGTTASEVQLSTDSKADRIVLEATVVGGSLFFKAAEVENDGTDILFDITDESLAQQFLAWASDGHDVPPIARNITSHRERLWLSSQVVHTVGTASFTNGSTNVPEGSTDPDWSADALGDSTASPVTTSSVTWLIQKDGDARAYEITEYDESATKIVLAENYVGTTSTNSNYTIFSRANVIWVSNPGYPESFTPLSFLNGPNGELSGDLTASVGYGPVMLFFSLSGMYRFSFDTNPLTDGVLEPISQKYGALNQRVVVSVEGVVYSMDHLGWQAWDGVFPRHISRPVDDLRSSIDYTLSDNFHATFFPDLRAIRWYVTYTGDTYPKNYVQLDIDTGSWSTGEHEVEISESRLVPTSAGPVVYFGDENGHLWIADTGEADGCDETYSHLTVDTGASTTSIPTTGLTLPTTNVGLAGCMAHWVEGDEDKLISSNTATTLTTAAFTAAPAEGDTIWVGSIPSRLKTKAFLGARGRRVRRDHYATVAFEPTASLRRMQVRVYKDYSAAAETWGSKTFRKALPGLEFPGSNDDYAAADWLLETNYTGGVVRVPMGGDFKRSLEIEFEIKEPDCPLEIFHIEVDGEEVERTK